MFQITRRSAKLFSTNCVSQLEIPKLFLLLIIR